MVITGFFVHVGDDCTSLTLSFVFLMEEEVAASIAFWLTVTIASREVEEEEDGICGGTSDEVVIVSVLSSNIVEPELRPLLQSLLT